MDELSSWEIITNLTINDGFIQPWFVSTKGAMSLPSAPNHIFITCEDDMNGQIWTFNTNTFTFDIITVMPIPLEDCCAVSSDNKIYIFGGDDTEKVYNITQIYDYIGDEWSFGQEIPIKNGIELHVCENVKNEFIYLFGGSNGGLNGYLLIDDTSANMNGYKYDIGNDEWMVIENVFEDIDDYAHGVTFLGSNYMRDTPYI